MAEDRRTSLAPAGEAAPGTDLRPYLPGVEPERQVNDWGRSERVEGLMDRTLIEFFYQLWFRCEVEGIENVPAEGGALLVSNHSGALPPDAPMIAKAIKEEHSAPAPAVPHRRALLQGLSRASACCCRRSARVPAHPANVHRLLYDEQPARARLPRGPQGDREALQGPLPPAALRPRRLRRGGDARPRADRPHRGGRSRGGRAGLRPGQAAAAADRPALLPDHADLPALRPARDARATCRPSSSCASCRRCPPTTPPSATSRGRTRRWCRPSPTRSAPPSRTSSSTCSAERRSVWFG